MLANHSVSKFSKAQRINKSHKEMTNTTANVPAAYAASGGQLYHNDGEIAPLFFYLFGLTKRAEMLYGPNGQYVSREWVFKKRK